MAVALACASCGGTTWHIDTDPHVTAPGGTSYRQTCTVCGTPGPDRWVPLNHASLKWTESSRRGWAHSRQAPGPKDRTPAPLPPAPPPPTKDTTQAPPAQDGRPTRPEGYSRTEEPMTCLCAICHERMAPIVPPGDTLPVWWCPACQPDFRRVFGPAREAVPA